MLAGRISLPWVAVGGLLAAALALAHSPSPVAAQPDRTDVVVSCATRPSVRPDHVAEVDPIDVANAVELSAQYTIAYPAAMTAGDPQTARAALRQAIKLDLALGGGNTDQLFARARVIGP